MPSNQKISDLTEDTSASLSDYVPVVSAGLTITRRVNLARILALGGGGSGGSGGGNMLDAFIINVPGNPFGQNGHQVNIGDSISALLKLILAPAVQAVISAGTNQTVGIYSGLTIALTATEMPGSSPIVTRQWSITSGPAGLTINNPSQLNATLTGFTPASAGTYQLKYQTFDASGTEVDAYVSEVVIYNPPVISVQNVNIQLPSTSGDVSASVSVTAGSYPIQSIVYSLVSQQQGSSAAVSGNGQFTGFTVAGSYVCNVLVTDVNSHTSSANIPVNVVAASFSAIVDYVFLDHDGFAELQNADNLSYTGHYSIPLNNADWAMPWANAPANCFPVMRVLLSAGQTIKNRYTDAGNSTFGTDTFDGNSSTARTFTANGYQYYTWYAPANFVTTAGNTVNISIN